MKKCQKQSLSKSNQILPLLFFSIGAVDVYSKMRQKQHQSNSQESSLVWIRSDYWLIGFVAAVTAGILELIVKTI